MLQALTKRFFLLIFMTVLANNVSSIISERHQASRALGLGFPTDSQDKIYYVYKIHQHVHKTFC